jgi:hypothetical protein
MQVTYQLTAEDYRQGIQASRKRTAFGRWSYRVLLGIAGLAIAMAVVGGFGVIVSHNSKIASNLVPLFLLAVFWVLAIPGIPYLSARSQFNGSPSAKGPITLDVSDEGFRTKTQFSDSNIGWGAIIGFVEMKTIFALFPSPRIFYPVPKRAFTPEQLAEFRQLLEQKIKLA